MPPVLASGPYLEGILAAMAIWAAFAFGVPGIAHLCLRRKKFRSAVSIAALAIVLNTYVVAGIAARQEVLFCLIPLAYSAVVFVLAVVALAGRKEPIQPPQTTTGSSAPDHV